MSPIFILKGSISAGISSLDPDAPPVGLGVIASDSWGGYSSCGSLLLPSRQRWTHGHRQIGVSQGASNDIIEGLSP